jgi:hypothetical protein
MQSSLFFNRIAMCDVLDMDADKDLAGQVVSRPVDDITAQEGSVHAGASSRMCE